MSSLSLSLPFPPLSFSIYLLFIFIYLSLSLCVCVWHEDNLDSPMITHSLSVHPSLSLSLSFYFSL